MIANFFRHLEHRGARWLLISGQATILYGAATFSEDVDLWVEPSTENLERFKQALRDSHAQYYKLTPPLTEEYAKRHHGFHFTVPETDGRIALYLDVMGYPPRVSSFGAAWQSRCVFETDWGALHTVGIRDLVELKKTQRPRDYPIISRLVLAYMKQRGAALSDDDAAWAIDNVFSLSELKRLVQDYPQTVPRLREALMRQVADCVTQETELPLELEDAIEDFFDAKMAPLRREDRRFWRGVIDELRVLRANGRLMALGTRV